MKKSKKYLIGLIVILAVLIVIPLMIPVRTYLDQAQRMATEKMGVSVSIGDGRLQLLPTPRVIAQDIAIGAQQEVRVAALTVVPELSSLLADTKVINIELTRPIIQKSALEMVSAISGKSSEPGSTPSPVRVGEITIHALQLDWPGITLPELNLHITLAALNTLHLLTIETADNKLKAKVMPRNKGHQILINAERWRMPVGIPALIDQGVLEMYLHDKQLDISKIDIALYNGNLAGDAVLLWSKDWRISGKLKLTQLSVEALSRMISPSVYLSGNLFGNGRYSATAKQASGLADNLSADFKFNIHHGVLHGLDLIKLASLLTKQTQGGETQFDEFAGNLNVKGKQVALRDIAMRSGLLSASGQVKVKPDQALDGLVEVSLKKGISLTSIPLQVSGTVAQPSVMPTKAAMAGALAGTAILGPGVGTSLGVSAGGAVDKIKGLFQRN